MNRFVQALMSIFFLFAAAAAAVAEPPSAELYKMLPNALGGFHQVLSMRPLVNLSQEGLLTPSAFSTQGDQKTAPFIGAEVEYLSPNGQRLTVELVRLHSEADAYSLLTLIAKRMRDVEPTQRLNLGEVGTASIISARQLAFFKGRTFVRITSADPKSDAKDFLELARLFSDRLDRGDGDIPVLVKHLPSWQSAQQQALYAVTSDTLKGLVPGQPVFDAVSFEGGAEAVAASYGSAQLVLIEFNTPQLAGDNEQHIAAKLQELRSWNQPVPTTYRRVGNYAVFVFNSNQQTANELINQIQYEQVVQWLGDNPYWLKEAQRRYTETTLGVLIAVVKASGLTLVGCFGLGGLMGAILFTRRRARQATTEAFSDAGGMLRLNLDDMTPQTDPARLLAGRN